MKATHKHQIGDCRIVHLGSEVFLVVPSERSVKAMIMVEHSRDGVETESVESYSRGPISKIRTRSSKIVGTEGLALQVEANCFKSAKIEQTAVRASQR